MRKLFILILAISACMTLGAIDEVNSENIAGLLQAAGYDAYVDDDGDVAFYDEYDMLYWATPGYPDENSVYIQSGWVAASDIKSPDAFRLTNESNRQMFTIRCYYEPLTRTFYADYIIKYPETGLDEDLFIETISSFLAEADTYTSYLIGEGAI